MRNNRNSSNSLGSTEETEKMLDNQNREMTEQLSQKVSRLKNLAFDIETETKEHGGLLDNFGGDMDSGNNLLSGSLARVHGMLGTGRSNRKLFLYICLSLVVIFFF